MKTRLTKKYLATRMIEACKAAAAISNNGRCPRMNAGDPMTIQLAQCAMQQGNLKASLLEIVDFEVAWRIKTTESIKLIKQLALDAWTRRNMRKMANGNYNSASKDDKDKVDHYATLHGKQRKRYGFKHSVSLTRAGARYGSTCKYGWTEAKNEALESHPQLA